MDRAVGACADVHVRGRHVGVHGDLEAQLRVVGGDRRARVARPLWFGNRRDRMGAQQFVTGPAPVIVCGGDVRLASDLRIQPGDPAAPVEQGQGHVRTSVLGPGSAAAVPSSQAGSLN